nr:MAG TPA: hypothetical protein [Caudoviricetes sp.]
MCRLLVNYFLEKMQILLIIFPHNGIMLIRRWVYGIYHI